MIQPLTYDETKAEIAVKYAIFLKKLLQKKNNAVKFITALHYHSIVDLIYVIDRCKEYWNARMDSKLENFFKLVNDLRKKDSMSLLIVSDYNTTGLTGSKSAKYEKTKWNALTHSDGVSDKGEDRLYRALSNAKWFMLLLLMVVGTIFKKYLRKELRDFQFILNLSIIGLLLFLLIWETRSRYLVNYSPIFLVNAYIGLNAIINYYKEKKIKE